MELRETERNYVTMLSNIIRVRDPFWSENKAMLFFG